MEPLALGKRARCSRCVQPRCCSHSKRIPIGMRRQTDFADSPGWRQAKKGHSAKRPDQAKAPEETKKQVARRTQGSATESTLATKQINPGPHLQEARPSDSQGLSRRGGRFWIHVPGHVRRGFTVARFRATENCFCAAVFASGQALPQGERETVDQHDGACQLPQSARGAP